LLCRAAAVTVQSCVRTWKKRRADRSARRFFRWGEKKMEKEKERMQKTLGGGAVTRRRR